MERINSENVGREKIDDHHKVFSPFISDKIHLWGRGGEHISLC